jgi:hypothetical protein
MKSFWHYYLGVAARPRRTFDELVTDPRRLRHGFLALLLTAFLYTLVYLFLRLGGGLPSTFTPWLNIPKEVYYRYNLFLAAPSILLGWVLAAGVMQLLARLFSGTGSFEDSASVVGFSIAIPIWATMLHDLVSSFLGAVHIISARAHELAMNTPTFWRALLWCLFAIYFAWFPVVFSKGAGAAQRLRVGPAILLGTVSFAVFQAFFVLFNR